jgi:hypothetical protein
VERKKEGACARQGEDRSIYDGSKQMERAARVRERYGEASKTSKKAYFVANCNKLRVDIVSTYRS